MNQEQVLIMNQKQMDDLFNYIQEIPFKYAHNLIHLIQPHIKPINVEQEERKEK